MARGQLSGLGVSYSKPSEGDTNRLTDIIEKTAINNTAYGRVDTVQDAQTVIDALSRAPQTLYTQEKILDWANKKEQLVASAQDMMMSRTNFDEELQGKLKDAARENVGNPRALMAAYADIYSQYADAYDAYLDDKVIRQYGSTSSIPKEVAEYGQVLREKAAFNASLFNSYNFVDEQGNLGANAPGGLPIETGAVAMVVTTNPATGKITGVEYLPADQVPSGYMRTDVDSNVYGMDDATGYGQNKLPVYVRGYAVPTKDGTFEYQARLGSLTFKGEPKDSAESAGKAVLQLQGDERFLGVFGGDNAAVDVRQQGLFLSDPSFQFDKYDIPNLSIVRAGGKSFFQGATGELYEIQGADEKEREANLSAYYTKWGVNKDNVQTFYADKTYLSRPDGQSRVGGVIDKSTTQVDPGMAPPTPGASAAAPISFGTPQTPGRGLGIADAFFASQLANPAAAPTAIGARAASAVAGEVAEGVQSFFGAKNRQSTPQEQAPARTASDVVESGKQFFRGVADRFMGRV